jgi:hypothetical protein
VDTAYASTLCRQGLDALKRHDHHGAFQAFAHCLSLTPDDGEAQAGLGMTYALMGEIDQAVHLLSRAARLRPDTANIHYNLGLVLERAGRAEDAFNAYKEAVRYEPHPPRARERFLALAAELGLPTQLETAPPPPPVAAPPPPPPPTAEEEIPVARLIPPTMVEAPQEVLEVEPVEAPSPPPRSPPSRTGRPGRPRHRLRFPGALLLEGGESFGGTLNWRVEEADEDWLILVDLLGTRYTFDGENRRLICTRLGGVFGSKSYRAKQLKDARFVIERDQFRPEQEVCDARILSRTGDRVIVLTDVPTHLPSSTVVLRVAAHMAMVLDLPFHLKIRPAPSPCRALHELLELARQHVDP